MRKNVTENKECGNGRTKIGNLEFLKHRLKNILSGCIMEELMEKKTDTSIGNIEELKLSYEDNEKVSLNMSFVDFKNLKKLVLDNIKTLSIKDLPDCIEEIYINNCDINKIDLSSLYKKSNLKVIDLSCSEIGELLMPEYLKKHLYGTDKVKCKNNMLGKSKEGIEPIIIK